MFNVGDPIAYFLTWTTYGTWLSGDERGWHRWGEGGVQPPDRLLNTIAATAMKEPACELTLNQRRIVDQTIVDHCRIRTWKLHAVNARSNHVHVVVAAPGYDPKTVRDQLKAWCTRRLKEAGAGRRRFWTEGGSCRWINHTHELEAAIRYVVESQDRKNLDELPARRASE